MKERYLKLEKISDELDKLIESIKNKEKDNDEIVDAVFDIYSDYCEISGGHSSGRYIAKELYDIYDNPETYFNNDSDSDSDSDDDFFSDKYEDLISKLEEIQSELDSEAKNHAASNGLMPHLENMLLSKSSGRLRTGIDEDYEGYASDIEAADKMWKRAQKAEDKFYDPSRTKSDETRRLSGSFLNARRANGASVPINTNNIPGRRIITAEVSAVELSLRAVDPKQLKSADDIAAQTGWHKGNGQNWNREKLLRGKAPAAKKAEKDVVVNSQYHPSAENLGNTYVGGVGSYGEGKSGRTVNILTLINELTNNDPRLERRLAELFVRFLRDGQGFNTTLLETSGLHLAKTQAGRKQQIERLNRMGFLSLLKEVSRRKNQGFKTNSDGEVEKILELPFGLAGAMTLKMLVDGFLRMADVFNADSQYGVFTGDKIMHPDNLQKTKNKFHALFKLYCDNYKPDEANFIDGDEFFYEGVCIPLPDHLHKLMQEYYAGNDDTSGDEYSSSDDDTDQLMGRLSI